jgi:hypothetical protein
LEAQNSNKIFDLMRCNCLGASRESFSHRVEGPLTKCGELLGDHTLYSNAKCHTEHNIKTDVRFIQEIKDVLLWSSG